jgi:hypothetical protein
MQDIIVGIYLMAIGVLLLGIVAVIVCIPIMSIIIPISVANIIIGGYDEKPTGNYPRNQG